MNMQTFNAMRSGAKAMQDARGRLDVDQVDDVMDDIKDEMDIAEQVREGGRGSISGTCSFCINVGGVSIASRRCVRKQPCP